jgi:hypothetical protein
MPTEAVPYFATLVRQHLNLITAAVDIDQRSQAALNLLLLPTVFLPKSAPTTRVLSHVQLARPFHINIHATAQSHAQPQDGRSRLSKMVQRLAEDRKIKEAVKIMQSEAEAPDVNFDDKLKVLREKFIARVRDLEPFDGEQSPHVVPFAGKHVHNVVKKLSKNAATCIDGWSRDLLMQCFLFDATIADSFGVFLSCVANGWFNALFMDTVRLGRLVGIPKPTGGIRPIVISSSFARLCGSLILTRTKVTCSKAQYAINKKDGAARIVHLARQRAREGKVILRFDSSNAFNVAPRRFIQELLHDKHPDLMRYFQTIYAPSSQLAVFNPDGEIEYVTSEEGVRQGDALSSYFFCLLMDFVCDAFKSAFPHDEIWSYMDDLTVAVDPERADAAAKFVVEELANNGFRPNVTKSKAFAFDSAFNMETLETIRPDLPFVMLGGNISNAYEAFNNQQADKINKFFGALEMCDVHAQIKWTILRLCGYPKVEYYARVTPPEDALPVLQHFDTLVRKSVDSMLDASISDEVLHHRYGAGFPDYISNCGDLFQTMQHAALTNAPRCEKVELVTHETSSPSTALLEHQHEAPYLFYSRNTAASEMTDAQFRLALCIRFRVLPRELRTQVFQCNCGQTETRDKEIIEHVMRCDRSTPVTHTVRHNKVRDAMATIARAYGIGVTSEPQFYSGYYESEHNQRPDLTFNILPTPIATDLTIVAADATPGTACAKAAQHKINVHKQAVQTAGHSFVPFALELDGHRDKHCFRIGDSLISHVRPYARETFAFDWVHAISVQLAVGRAEALRAAIARFSHKL